MNEVWDERLKRAIIHKAIKSGCNKDGCLMRYGGKLYYINIAENKVVPQSEVK